MKYLPDPQIMAMLVYKASVLRKEEFDYVF